MEGCFLKIKINIFDTDTILIKMCRLYIEVNSEINFVVNCGDPFLCLFILNMTFNRHFIKFEGARRNSVIESLLTLERVVRSIPLDGH